MTPEPAAATASPAHGRADGVVRQPPKRVRGKAAVAMLVAHAIGFVSSVHALMTVRTAQGTIAWVVSLNTMPLLAVPAYWVFGRSKFAGYVVQRQSRDLLADPQARAVAQRLQPLVPAFARAPGSSLAGQRLAKLPYLGGNDVELLVDGKATFDSLLAGIDRARHYVLVQFYIVRDDHLGRELRDRLAAKAREGVEVRFLYDELGSSGLPRSYRERLAAAGVRMVPFGSTRGWGNRFQVNVRNHRKIVVVDGTEGWVGGLNVGDEYLGRDPEVGAWRDTHVRIAGPAVLGLQLSFVEDWNWATGHLLFRELAWPAQPRGEIAVLIVPSGPADRLETMSLLFQQAVQSAQRRVWIATPYFVPDGAVLGALDLAALRGVDVRLLIPERSDSRIVDAAAESFLEPLLGSGIQVYRYRGGFLHSKHLVIDERVGAVGTPNVDNRSFRLNFEVTAVVADPRFARQVAAMFERDVARSRLVVPEELSRRPLWRRAFSRGAHLLSSVL
jgi:cardiolipin synthase